MKTKEKKLDVTSYGFVNLGEALRFLRKKSKNPHLIHAWNHARKIWGIRFFNKLYESETEADLYAKVLLDLDKGDVIYSCEGVRQGTLVQDSLGILYIRAYSRNWDSQWERVVDGAIRIEDSALKYPLKRLAVEGDFWQVSDEGRYKDEVDLDGFTGPFASLLKESFSDDDFDDEEEIPYDEGSYDPDEFSDPTNGQR